MVLKDVINNFSTNFVWKVENLKELRQMDYFSQNGSIKLKPMKVGNGTRFLWFAEISEGCANDFNSGKSLLLSWFIYSENCNGFYDKFMHKCEITFSNENRNDFNYSTPVTKLTTYNCYEMNLPYSKNFIELKFNIIVKEYDLSGSKVKAIDSPIFKQNLMRDVDGLDEITA